MKYQINPSATLLSKKIGPNNHTIQFLLDGTRTLYRFSVPLIGKKILIALYDQMSDSEITKKFNVSVDELMNFLNPLLEAGLVLREHEIVPTSKFGNRNTRTVEFFHSFFTPTNTTHAMTEKLLGSSILVLGLGCIGSWVVEMFARIGVGKITIIDNDIVEESNIPRQAIFTLNDLRKHKVDVALRYIKSLSPNTNVCVVRKRIEKTTDLLPYLTGIQLVINCADKPDTDRTNSLVTRACFKKKHIPHILCGGYDGHLSFLGQTVIPKKSSCWFCYTKSGIYEHQLDGFEIIERNTTDHIGGTICPISVQVASFQVMEAVKVITGCSKPVMLNRKAEINFSKYSLTFTHIPKNKNCPFCSK